MQTNIKKLTARHDSCNPSYSQNRSKSIKNIRPAQAKLGSPYHRKKKRGGGRRLGAWFKGRGLDPGFNSPLLWRKNKTKRNTQDREIYSEDNWEGFTV
jgi:hypothetical protein